MRARRVILVWTIAIVAAALLDRYVATWMRESGVEGFLRDDSHKWLRTTLKAPGETAFTIAVAFAVTFFHPLRWRAGAFMLLAVIISGANALIKWIAGRHRPFKWDEAGALMPFAFRPFRGGLDGLFESKNLCFPSGHASLAFATATALAILWPRARLVFYALACMVAVERFAENAHWLSDTVAGAALGVGGVYLIRNLLGARLRLPRHQRESDPGFPVAVADR